MIQILTEYDRNNMANLLWKNESLLENVLAQELKNNIKLLRTLFLSAGVDVNILPRKQNYLVRTQMSAPTGKYKENGEEVKGRMDICITDRETFYAVIELKTFTATHETGDVMNQLQAYNNYCDAVHKKRPNLNIIKILIYPQVSGHAKECEDAASAYGFNTATLENLVEDIEGSNNKISALFATYIDSLKQNMFDRDVDEDGLEEKTECFDEEITRLANKNNISYCTFGDNNNGYKLWFNNTNPNDLAFYVMPQRGNQKYFYKNAQPMAVADKIACFCKINKEKDEDDMLWEIQSMGLDEYWISFKDMENEYDNDEEKIKNRILFNIRACLNQFFNLIEENEFNLTEDYCKDESTTKKIGDRLNDEGEIIAKNKNEKVRYTLFYNLQNTEIGQYMGAITANHNYVDFLRSFFGSSKGKIHMGIQVALPRSKYNDSYKNISSIFMYTVSSEFYNYLQENLNTNEMENKTNTTVSFRDTGEGKAVHFFMNDFTDDKVNDKNYINDIVNKILTLKSYFDEAFNDFKDDEDMNLYTNYNIWKKFKCLNPVSINDNWMDIYKFKNLNINIGIAIESAKSKHSSSGTTEFIIYFSGKNDYLCNKIINNYEHKIKPVINLPIYYWQTNGNFWHIHFCIENFEKSDCDSQFVSMVSQKVEQLKDILEELSNED